MAANVSRAPIMIGLLGSLRLGTRPDTHAALEQLGAIDCQVDRNGDGAGNEHGAEQPSLPIVEGSGGQKHERCQQERKLQKLCCCSDVQIVHVDVAWRVRNNDQTLLQDCRTKSNVRRIVISRARTAQGAV
jgi:hypothetical protein